jgi:hypothetical protein
MIDLPYIDSRSTACVFIAMLSRLAKKPNISSTTASMAEVDTNDNRIRLTEYNKAAIIRTPLLPFRERSHAVTGRLMICPTGRANNTIPNPASLR